MQNLNENDIKNYWYTHMEKFSAFETIIVPKNFTVYHGGGALKANVEFPIGIEYYRSITDPQDPRRITSDQREVLKNQSIPQNMIKKYSEDITLKYIEYSFFGTYHTAKKYASKVPGCGINCVGVYKFREKTNIVDMGNAGTIHSLLFSPNILDQIDKEFLAEAYGITSLDPDRRNEFWKLGPNANLEFINPVRKSLRNDKNDGYNPYRPDKPAYFIIPKLIDIFKTFGFKGIANPRTIHRFSEFIIFNPLETLRRDVSNEIDWQKQPDLELFGEMGVLIQNMKLYDTTNIDFHAGDLYAHSVWVALNVQKWLAEGNKWSENLKVDSAENFNIISKLTIISAFLHDIGKMGGLLVFYDKPDHPTIGAEYLSNKRELSIKDKNIVRYLDVETLFTEIIPEGFDKVFAKNFIIGIILHHWSFGDYLRKYRDGKLTLDLAKTAYLIELRQWWETKYPSAFEGGQKNYFFKLFATCLMIISACDVLGSQVFVDDSIYQQFAKEISLKSKVNVNAFLLGYEYIVNAPKKHRGGDKFKEFEYDTVGFALYQAVYKEL